MITVSFNGEKITLGLLDAVQDALDVEDILDEAQALLLNRIKTRFLNEESATDGKWIPSAAGLKRRAAGGTGTLFKTGTLFHSIQAFPHGLGERSIGTDVFYGKYHQFGEGIQLRREFLGFNDEDLYLVERRILQRIQEYLE